jgi:hypothetical protein
MMKCQGGKPFSRTEGVRKLRHREYAFVVLLLPFLFAEFGKKAEVVGFSGNGSASSLKLALDAVAVQDKGRESVAAPVLPNSRHGLPGFLDPFVKRQGNALKILSVNNFTNSWHVTKAARQRQSIECKARPINRVDLLSDDESDGNVSLVAMLRMKFNGR